MKNEIIHRWRCMNCKEMANSFICSHCGKESYIKENEKDNSIKVINDNPKNSNQIDFKSDYESNKINSVTESTIKKELSIYVKQVNADITEVSKAIKIILFVLIALFIVQFILFAIKYSSIKKSILSFEETNKSLSALVNTQNEKINDLKKSIDEYSDHQIKYVVHTVKEGETLIGICKEYNIDFGTNKKIIYSINGIESSGNIQVGQVLILPDLN